MQEVSWGSVLDSRWTATGVGARQEQRTRRALESRPPAASFAEAIVGSGVFETGSEIVIHAMRIRARYEPFLRGEGDSDA